MAKKSFSKSEAIGFGWKSAWGKLGFFVGLLLIIIAVSALPSIAAEGFRKGHAPTFAFLAQLIGWAVQLTVSLGVINVTLRLVDKKKATYGDLFNEFHLIIPYFLASIIYGAIVIVGLILLIVPGIIWSIKFQYFSYLMVDRGMGPIDALKKSAELTSGVKWNLFFLKLLIGVINIGGAVVLLVGLFVTVPLGMMAETYVYRKLNPRK